MNLEDWDLAALVMTKSDITPQSALDAIIKAKATHNRAQGFAAGEREVSSSMWWTEARPSESADYY